MPSRTSIEYFITYFVQQSNKLQVHTVLKDSILLFILNGSITFSKAFQILENKVSFISFCKDFLDRHWIKDCAFCLFVSTLANLVIFYLALPSFPTSFASLRALLFLIQKTSLKIVCYVCVHKNSDFFV